ncbi:MAG: GDP-fucose synthetase [Spirochaetes bacterium GWF1_31_7]|nr:MAG: GDP-fucose synthetase [Spirochaetes bacterium GWE1_32_154]OHD45665.1 MAG: GDP-fucose synthetase [Spirochaetes bacterium GWE2_31_10]OHD48236.1 MAG: GDP-fucose synthetase [Spirochaetes bacterium GWF1_31_7]OHD73366.1 MAG: GDP-fucose synthetase [Spirochaetes bacterium RIFOXYB1_FULL_32_8]HBD95773.1 GDP-fucose synthetase [Spirochaetia bacterium]
MKKNSKIYVAGHRGLVGSAILRVLEKNGYTNIVYKAHSELDLCDGKSVSDFFIQEKPEYVFFAAAKVGGILANKTYKGDFIYQNLQIQNNIIHNAHLNNVKKLLFLGSSCIYPKLCPQPIKEEYLLSGHLEETNDAYAIAKIAGLMMCRAYREQYKQDFISAMPTNLYGYNDNFDLSSSHVLPALIRKIEAAKDDNAPEVVVWGTGTPMREFLFVDDLADALLFLMENYSDFEHINVGTGIDVTIRELAETICKVVGYEGKLTFDTSKPDGTPRKLLDVSKINNCGWKAKISLEEGIRLTYSWYVDNYKAGK